MKLNIKIDMRLFSSTFVTKFLLYRRLNFWLKQREKYWPTLYFALLKQTRLYFLFPTSIRICPVSSTTNMSGFVLKAQILEKLSSISIFGYLFQNIDHVTQFDSLLFQLLTLARIKVWTYSDMFTIRNMFSWKQNVTKKTFQIRIEHRRKCKKVSIKCMPQCI